jgi:ACT domain-containing protein
MTSPFLRLKINVFINHDKTSHADTNSKRILLNGISTFEFIHKAINTEFLLIIVAHMQHGDVNETFLSPG